MTDTIYALATAAGRAAVAVVRVSGPKAGAALQSLSGRPPPSPRQASVRRLADPSGNILDEALVIYFEGPNSFTGEDVVELHLHGGRAVVLGVVGALADIGLRQADPGEFTRRAFEHGRMSLSEAEAVADLVDAETEAQRTQALGQLGGALEKRFAQWREALLGSLALVEAAIDFPDEDLPPDVSFAAKSVLVNLRSDLTSALADTRGERIREGLRVALVGAPNAGKSSLFNALVGRDAAIVTAIPGTTRDIIEASLVLDGYRIVVADTAGLRDSADVIEAEGVRRAVAWAAEADLRLHVVDALAGRSPADGVEADWLVLNKSDLAGAAGAADERDDLPTFSVSALSGDGIDALRSALGAYAVARLGGSDFPAATRLRHR